MYSYEHINYLKKIKKKKLIIKFIQISIIILFITIWEFLAKKNIINTFIFSSPSKIINTITNLHKTNNLYKNIFITIYETLISFFLATFIGIIVATLMWWNDYFAKIIEPYLTLLNSLPKVALGPIIIIWSGAGIKSIIIMALLISTIISIIDIYQGFINTDKNKIKLMKTFKATKFKILKKLIFPSNINTIVSVLKVNISMSLIGVIMGEFLVSKEGIGYLIMYGSQIFNLNLVIAGIIILSIISIIMYYLVKIIENKITK